jgi:hypothetical protein
LLPAPSSLAVSGSDGSYSSCAVLAAAAACVCFSRLRLTFRCLLCSVAAAWQAYGGGHSRGVIHRINFRGRHGFHTRDGRRTRMASRREELRRETAPASLRANAAGRRRGDEERRTAAFARTGRRRFRVPKGMLAWPLLWRLALVWLKGMHSV